MTDKNANTEIRKEFCPNCEADTPCTHEAEINELKAEIERLKSERRWIPVSERLPEENEDVLICDRCGEVTVCSRLEGYDGIVQFHIDSIVTHWMPLPEPPEEE